MTWAMMESMAGVLYPMEGRSEKVAYRMSASCAVTLFVLNCLILSGIHIPHIGWINLALVSASFGIALMGGVWNHRVNNTVSPGAFKEILQTIPLIILSLVGGAGGCSLETMSRGIIGVQAAFTLSYYACVPQLMKQIKEIGMIIITKMDQEAEEEFPKKEQPLPVPPSCPEEVAKTLREYGINL